MDENDRYLRKIVTIFICIVILFYFLLATTGCTLSFQNISTHGTATDLVDENQSPSNDVKTNLSIPLNKGI